MKQKWYKLDNAALIFPAVMRSQWNNAFRLSVTLSEPVDPELLARAAADIKKRFPTFFVRLKTGFFWYYLEEIKGDIIPGQDYAYPLTHMSRRELKKSCVRILYYENRIAAEFFHSVSDGTGGCVFIKTLAARYLELKYGSKIPAADGILDIDDKPTAEEIEDGFLKASSRYQMKRDEGKAFHPSGTFETEQFRNLVTGIVSADTLREEAHKYGVTVTAFLAAVMADSLAKLQAGKKRKRHQKPVQVSVPVNLRKLYGINTLRNFALPVYVGFDPRTGDYSLAEICSIISHQLASDAIPQRMAGRIAANVNPQKNGFIRVVPLPVKNIIMRIIYMATGERYGGINISNLGEEKLPDEMTGFIKRMEFIIGVQYTYPNNCSVVSYGGKTYINIIRSIKESELERLFFSELVSLGIPVEIESNKRQ